MTVTPEQLVAQLERTVEVLLNGLRVSRTQRDYQFTLDQTQKLMPLVDHVRSLITKEANGCPDAQFLERLTVCEEDTRGADIFAKVHVKIPD